MDPAKLFIIGGIILILVGIYISYGPSIPFLGKLPGDIYIKRDNFTFYFPITTSILVSIILSLMWRMLEK
ncbi:MAG TPA: DUF2905 domain-containing protein [Candidatus Woesebacteria bacterium]|nr:DUF2905 domain-containing protein [Candidatus Woesebacteria bacterium]